MSLFYRFVLLVQSAFYILTGAWPIVSLRTFEMVTGPKVDGWLVHMVGLLAVVIGLSLLTAAWLRSGGPMVSVLAIGSALAFTMIDLYYVGMGRIGAIYLVDAGTETLLALLLIVAMWKAQKVRPKLTGTEPAYKQ